MKFFFQPIKQVIDLTKSKSIIDFGCGKAKYYFEEIIIKNNSYSNINNYWNIDDIYLYDPGVNKFSFKIFASQIYLRSLFVKLQ